MNPECNLGKCQSFFANDLQNTVKYLIQQLEEFLILSSPTSFFSFFDTGKRTTSIKMHPIKILGYSLNLEMRSVLFQMPKNKNIAFKVVMRFIHLKVLNAKNRNGCSKRNFCK